jgi:hypothetical protein
MSKLTVIEQKEVTFYDDELTAVRGRDSQIYVSVAQICKALGIDARSQRRRIQNHEILAEGYTRGDILTPPSPDGRGGGRQMVVLLRVDLLPLWLAGIEAGKASDEMRPKLARFQRNAAKELWEAFQEGRLTSEPDIESLLQEDTPEAQAYKMIQGMLQLARNQLLIRGQLQDHERRLEEIESQLGSADRQVTPDQASQISQAVKAVAMILTKQTKQNQYGSVYGEMYRKFGITSYKQLPAGKFDDCMTWLTEWHQSLADDAF